MREAKQRLRELSGRREADERAEKLAKESGAAEREAAEGGEGGGGGGGRRLKRGRPSGGHLPVAVG